MYIRTILWSNHQLVVFTISLHNLFSDQLPKEIDLYKNPEVLGIIYIYKALPRTHHKNL